MDYSNPKALLGHIGAIQAQDYNMSKWAVGLRLQAGTVAAVEQALTNAEIIRTHVLRPTWHIVSADDIYWMLDLTAGRIKGTINSSAKKIGLSEDEFLKSEKLMEKALEGNRSLSRDALVAVLVENGIPMGPLCASFLLMRAELDGILCSGPSFGNAHGYALLQEVVPLVKRLAKEEALEKLARMYFFSHAPASLGDFIWWSGLTAKEARQGLEAIKQELQVLKMEGEEYWLPQNITLPQPEADKAFLLAAFDEIIISYKAKTGTLAKKHFSKVISSNAIFKPTIVANAEVVGIWKRINKKNNFHIEMEYFNPSQSFDLEKEMTRYRSFWENL